MCKLTGVGIGHIIIICTRSTVKDSGLLTPEAEQELFETSINTTCQSWMCTQALGDGVATTALHYCKVMIVILLFLSVRCGDFHVGVDL